MVALVLVSGASFTAGVLAERPRNMPGVSRTHGDFGAHTAPRSSPARPQPSVACDREEQREPEKSAEVAEAAPEKPVARRSAAPWRRRVPRARVATVEPPAESPEVDTTDLEPEHVAGTEDAPPVVPEPGTSGLDALDDPVAVPTEPPPGNQPAAPAVAAPAEDPYAEPRRDDPYEPGGI
jgi:hypothetical protein